MTSTGYHDMSDTDSDVTVGPEEDEQDLKDSPKKSIAVTPSLNKRKSEVHEISDSDGDSEEFYILKENGKKKTKPSNKKLSATLKKKEQFSEKLSESTIKYNSNRESVSTSVKSNKFSSDAVSKTPVATKKTEIDNWLDNVEFDANGKCKLTLKTNINENAQKDQSKHDNHSSPSITLKRKQTVLLENDEKKTPSKKLPLCQYGSKCYRKNPSHFAEFSHQDDEQKRSTSGTVREGSPPRKKHKMRSLTGSKDPDEVYSDGQPYSFFLTKVHGIQDKYNNVLVMDIKDILSAVMGTLQASCQFNYMFEIPWLMKQYPEQFRSKPLLLVHGFTGGNKSALEIEATKYSNIKFCQARLEMMYGTHHTKMMLLLYEEGMRVVIHTSNLIERDWYQKTQGMWISPLFPKLKKEDNKSNYTKGDSPTNFKKDLLEYIASYKAYQLKEWQQHIADHDMSSANVFIIGSSPGRHSGENKHSFGHMKLRKVLNTHGPQKDYVKSWPVIGQYSSIGSLGATKEAWLCTEFLQSLATVEGSSVVPLASINLQLIFPTKDNVRCSLEGYPAGASIPYSINVAKKQQYLHTFFHHWKSVGRGRSRAMPHIKTYCRPSPSSQEVAWFLVTSSNLSKAAWGSLEKKGAQLMIRSYEIGVLFLPKFFGNKKSFHVSSDIEESGKLLLPYDLPLKKYEKEDRPWIWDIAYKDLPDSNGNMWCPS